ncbi:MAG TPA: GFA family protein [Myxococcota bacterium]|nr:GFA family protein [Myxococcota bacterium]
MHASGGCYCGRTRYESIGEPTLRIQCHCRECQYISGGGPVFVMAMPRDGFAWTQGEPRRFRRSDLESPVTREFCPECGTHLTTRSPGLPDAVLIKVGTLDEPGIFGGPQVAIHAAERPSFHSLPEDIPVYDGRPG